MVPYAILIGIAIASWILVSPDVLPRMTWFSENLDRMPEFFFIKRYPLFEIHHLLWEFFILWVTCNFARDEKSWYTAIIAIAICIFTLTLSALFQRYIQGSIRVTGLGHINVFNSYVGLLGIFIMPIPFITRSFLASTALWFTITCGLVTIILTISRASLIAFIFWGFVICVISLYRSYNAKNLLFMLIGAMLALGLLVKAAQNLMTRFSAESAVEDIRGRQLLNEAGVMMAKDHILGVGLGNFSAWNWNKYHELTNDDPESIAHNIWFLNLAEIGIFGLLAFIGLWLRFFQITFKALYWSYSDRSSLIFPLLLGALISAFYILFVNFFHFTYRVNSVTTMLHIFVGIAIGLYMILKDRKKLERMERNNRLLAS
jgi:hypothetical protein